MRQRTVTILIAAVATVVVACGSGDSGATPTATPAATTVPTGTAPATQPGEVRDLDFADLDLIGPMIDHFGGGEVEPERVQYLDITGDGIEEAFVIVASGGTAGDLGAALVTVAAGQPLVLGYVDAAGRIEVRFPEAGGGVVVAQSGIYEAGDPLCCPTNLRERVYRWVDDSFELISDQVIANPSN